MRYCCFRFDADTHVCVSEGIPRLAELADELDVKFTFFVNMGRAFAPSITLAKMIRRVAGEGNRNFVPAVRKLGWQESVKAAILNPRAGRSDPAALKAAEIAGHEIGLHGGRNHAHWEKSAHRWSKEQLRDEIRTGMRWMAESGLKRPTAFASPAWNSPDSLRSLLPGFGFRILADVYSKGECAIPAREEGLVHIPTNITAAPGTAGYLETMKTRGWNQLQTVRDFRAQLATSGRLAVVYDHPFFAGTHALRELRELVKVALTEGFTVCTISAAVDRLCGSSESPTHCLLS